jgi:hypothetical protein
VTEKDIAAVVQPRIHSAAKVPLEDQVPLDTPFSVHIDVSSVCNYKCSFCFQADAPSMKEVGLKRAFMDVELFKKIVDDLHAFDGKIKKIKIVTPTIANLCLRNWIQTSPHNERCLCSSSSGISKVVASVVIIVSSNT